MRLSVAIVILMLVGGGIAYLGDWLGLYIGKRRLSLRGLRPRTTARVITAIAGAVIALLTFFILLAVDGGFKLAIQQGAQIIHRNHVLNAQNKRLEASVRAARGAAAQAEGDAQSARAAAAAAIQDRTKAQDQLASVDTQLTTVNGQLTTAQQQLASTRDQLTNTQNSLSLKEADLQQEKLRQVALTNEIGAAKTDLQAMARLTKARFLGSLIYRDHSEIGRTEINAGQSIVATRQQINIFLAQLSAAALERGGARGSNGHGVTLMPVEVADTAHEASASKTAHPQAPFTESDNINALADQIHNFDDGRGSVVVLARVTGNAFAGEQVKVILRPYINKPAIRAGTDLGQITIPANDRDPDQILNDLQRFLVQTVRPSAEDRGVIPVVNPQINEVQLGDVPVSELYRIIDEVRHIQGPAVVTAIAAQDTDAANLSGLQLKFTVTVPSASQEGYE